MFVAKLVKMNGSLPSLVLLLASLCHADSLRFIAIGDWGDDDGQQYEVGATMAAWADETAPEFVLSLGDNFYPRGVDSVTDEKWTTRWELPYMQFSSLQIPWMISVGNHDWDAGFIDPQVEYTNLNPYWTFPQPYFTFTKMAGNASILFVVLDTDVLRDQQDLQFQWLNRTLSEATEDWIIVYGHHPVYSTGYHGVWEEVQWRDENLKPLLREHNVALFICGHDHDQQHITDDSVVDYVVSGGGHEVRVKSLLATRQTENRGATLVWRRSSKGFLDVQVENNLATLSFVNEVGDVIYSFNKTNPRSV